MSKVCIEWIRTTLFSPFLRNSIVLKQDVLSYVLDILDRKSGGPEKDHLHIL